MVPQANKKSQKEKSITTAEAIRILRKNGVEISEKDAEKVLELMYFFAKLIVNQNFKK